MNYAQGLHKYKSGFGFPAAVSHFTCTGAANGDVLIVDFAIDQRPVSLMKRIHDNHR